MPDDAPDPETFLGHASLEETAIVVNVPVRKDYAECACPYHRRKREETGDFDKANYAWSKPTVKESCA